MEVARVITVGDGFIEFAVDDVEECTDPIDVQSFHDEWSAILGSEIVGTSHDREVVKGLSGHALVAAVHKAFAEHRPLDLSPDVFWLTIAQGFSNHINFHAEELRDRFVRHDGTKMLTVLTGSFDPQEMGFVTELFIEQMAEHVGSGVPNLFACDFTTSTEIDRNVSRITMMAAMQKYFEYRVYCICGIPRVVLRGTPEDWRAIRARVDVLAEYDLGWWTKRLASITDQLIRSAEGQPSLEFWQQICKPRDAYGGEVITGWITDLFPYLKEAASDRPMRRNELLKVRPSRRNPGQGVALREFPEGFCEAPLLLETPWSKTALGLVGGFAGVSADAGILRVETAWAVRRVDTFTAALNELAATYDFEARRKPQPTEAGNTMATPDRITLAFSTRYARGVMNWGEQRLELLHPEEALPVVFPGREMGAELARLDDGRRLVSFEPLYSDKTYYVLAWPAALDPGREVARDPDEWPAGDAVVVADDAGALLTALQQSEECAFFDAAGYQPLMTWEEALAAVTRAKDEWKRNARMRAPIRYRAQLDPDRVVVLTLRVADRWEYAAEELLGVLASRMRPPSELPIQRAAFEHMAETGELELVVGEGFQDEFEHRLRMRSISFEASTRTAEPEEVRELARYEASLTVWSPQGEKLSTEVLDLLSAELAEQLSSHRWYIRQALQQIGRRREKTSVMCMPVFGWALEEIDELAAELSSDPRWHIEAVAEVGTIAQNTRTDATPLCGVVDELFGSIFDGSRADDQPHVLYLRFTDSRRVHRFHIDSGMLVWGDHGRVLHRDVEEHDIIVDYAARWGLRGLQITDAAVYPDRVALSFSDLGVLKFGCEVTPTVEFWHAVNGDRRR